MDEIARWGRMSVTEQWEVMARLEQVRQQQADSEPRNGSVAC